MVEHERILDTMIIESYFKQSNLIFKHEKYQVRQKQQASIYQQNQAPPTQRHIYSKIDPESRAK